LAVTNTRRARTRIFIRSLTCRRYVERSAVRASASSDMSHPVIADHAAPTTKRPIGPITKITSRMRTAPITPRNLAGDVRPGLNLGLGSAGQRRDLTGRPGGPVVAERLGVHGVDRAELADVGHEHRRLRDVGERGAAVTQHRGDVREDLARLRLDPARD